LFETFYQRFIEIGLEYFKKFYGVYRAEVKRTDDPQSRGRVQILCPEVGHTSTINKWVDPSVSAAGLNRGMFWPPEVGDSAWVCFERGDPALPKVYFGGWYGTSDVPSEFDAAKGEPMKRGFVLRRGHSLVFTEKSGEEAIELAWRKPSSQPAVTKTVDRSGGDKAYVLFDKNGSITVENKNKTKIELDASGKKIVVTEKDNNNIITLDSGGVTIETRGKVNIEGASECNINAKMVNIAEGADTPAVRGQDLVQWLSTHTHGCAVGPTTPAVQAGTAANVLSKVTKLK
jgi:Type VI secretion system/phage-baseplate injector OB domain